jgi:GTP-binding protein Era
MELNTPDENFKSGFITILGQPNVGKSTLINRLIGEKMAITSRKAQTTRGKSKWILNLDDAQLVFVDTPGIHKSKDKMGEYLNKVAYNTLKEIDVILFMVNVQYPPNHDDKRIMEQLKGMDIPIILVLNKIDSVSRQKVAERMKSYQQLGEFKEKVAISALEETNLDHLVQTTERLLSPGPRYYPADMVTDQIEQFVIANLIREQILNYTHEEVPHSAAVEIMSFDQRPDDELIEIRANIYVERSSQKGIIIGKGGKKLKKIGKAARRHIEKFLGQKVFLDLWVKVEKNWRDREDALEMLGYRSH